MPRPKGSKNKPKTADKTTVVSTVDYTELIEEKLNEKTQISAEITSITDQLEALKAQLKESLKFHRKRTHHTGDQEGRRRSQSRRRSQEDPVRIHAPAVIKQRYEHG